MNTPNTTPEILHNSSTVYTEDGVRLSSQRWQPADGEIRAELLIVPGYADHAGRYREVAHALAPAGVAVTALDPRGHGRSEGARGYVARFQEYHLDVRAALAAILAGPPRFLLGHSQGALIVLDALLSGALRTELAGVVLTSPFLALSMQVPVLKARIADFAGRYLPKLAMPSGLRPEDMSRDAAMAEAYARDPLVFKNATSGWWAAAQQAQARVLASSSIPFPVLLFYSPDDPVANGEVTRRFSEQLASPDKTIKMRPQEKHELLNELDRAALHLEIRDWILAHAHCAPHRVAS